MERGRLKGIIPHTTYGTKAAGWDLSLIVVIVENLRSIFDIETERFLTSVKFFW